MKGKKRDERMREKGIDENERERNEKKITSIKEWGKDRLCHSILRPLNLPGSSRVVAYIFHDLSTCGCTCSSN